MDDHEDRNIIQHDIISAHSSERTVHTRAFVTASCREEAQSEKDDDEEEDKEEVYEQEEEEDNENDNEDKSESGESGEESYKESEDSSAPSWEEDHNNSDSWKFLRHITISRDQTQAGSYDLERLSAIKETLQRSQTAWSTSLWGDARGLASVGSDHTIRIWDSETRQCVSELQGHSAEVFSLAWSANDSRLASGSDDGTIRVWDLKTGLCVSKLSGHKNGVVAICRSLDGKLAGSHSRNVKIWNPKTGKCVLTLEGHSHNVTSIAWSADGSQLASASYKSIKIWNPKTGKCISTLSGHLDGVEAIAWSSDNSHLASGSGDGSIRIWDTETYECTLVTEGHTDWVGAIAWSPDGRRIASGSDDETVKIWDAETGECTLVIEGHTDWVGAIAWSPDGTRLASVSYETIKIWDPATGKCLSTFGDELTTPDALVWLASPEGKSIIQPSGWFKQPITGLTASRDLLLRQTPLVNENFTYPDRVGLLSDEFAPSPPLNPSLTSFFSPTPISHQSFETYATSDILSPSVTTSSQRQMDDNSRRSTLTSGTLASEMAKDSWEEMAQRVAQLEEENRRLKAKPQTPVTTTWQVLHIIKHDSSTYLSVPSWSGDAEDRLALRGHSPISDPKSYLDRRPDIAFVVYKFYDPEHQNAAVKKARDEASELPTPEPADETIRLSSKSMITAMEAFCNAQSDFRQCFPKLDLQAIPSPYLFWYHYRNNGTVDSLPTESNVLMKLLTEWIESSYGALYSKVEKQFSQGYVSSSVMPFLVRPGDLLVSKQGRTYEGYIASSWAKKKVTRDSERPEGKKEIVETWTVEVWSYKYDGRFYRHGSQIDIALKYTPECGQVSLTTLNAFPLRYADEGVKGLLERRGQAIWNCRVRNLVSYEDDEEDQLYGAGERFMIDYVTYKQLHSDPQTLKKAFPHLNVRDRKEISPEMMELDEPPPFPEGLVFPPTIIGYNLRQKKWLDLKVDRIHNANWNEDAFEHLVVDNETKVLIRALISSKVEADQGTDVIGGKGNGLIILLHGGPGTGKTFTAESVAEIARKPLYRVTCGDIGTKPQEVEKYLESVLYLGKIWDCVVLLDEADVFLEQRTLMDLERNALVSVFLRVLEYYEGILILTSNRVGTFDEAFKSRIQLSLHYEALTKSQRSTIWKNFITRLKTLETSAAQKSVESGNINNSERLTPEISNTQQLPSIDYGDIERHIEELAKLKMNGRQIRNIITTGRQLAKYERVQMSFSHLKRVIKVSSKFDDYLKKVTGNTDEEAAREDGRR